MSGRCAWELPARVQDFLKEAWLQKVQDQAVFPESASEEDVESLRKRLKTVAAEDAFVCQSSRLELAT